jgi:hypothetical protein
MQTRCRADRQIRAGRLRPAIHFAPSAMLLAALLTAACAPLAFAQPPGPPQPPRPAKAAAPVDLTGYWVSVVSEDWRWRMVTPIKGDFAKIGRAHV